MVREFRRRGPQSGGKGVGWRSQYSRIWRRFPNAIEGRRNSSSRLVQQGRGEEGCGCVIGSGMEISDQRTIVRKFR